MMIVLALLLLAAAGAVVYVVAADGTGQMTIDQFGLDTSIPVWAVFIVGAVTMLVVIVAVAALAAGVRNARARRTEIRYLRQKVASQELAGDRSATGEGAVVDETAVHDPDDDNARHGRTRRWRRRSADPDGGTDTDSEADRPPAGAAHS